MAIQSFRDVAAAYDAGRHWTGLLRRAGPVSVAGYWQDLSYAAGVPVANYYAATPTVSALLASNDGIQCGPEVEAAGYKKYLHKAMLAPPSTSVGLITAHIHDIVMYYPFIDGDGGEQAMTNNQTNRYDGAGCHIMMVSQGIGIGTTGATTIVYEDKDGNTVTVNNIQTKHDVPAGTLLTAADAVAATAGGLVSPYLMCPNGCKRIISFNFDVGVGGIFVAAIVRPLGVISVQEIGTPVEVDYFRDKLRPVPIDDGSYIGMIYRGTVGATPTNLMAELSFIWS
jgi:hypothetical protein